MPTETAIREDSGKKKPWYEELRKPSVLVSILMAIIAIGSLSVNFIQMSINKRDKELYWEVNRSDRLLKEISHLNDESIAIRKVALGELKKYAADYPETRETISGILSDFVRYKIESMPREQDELARPDKDVFLAADILSYIYSLNSDIRADFAQLQGDGINICEINFTGADLTGANLKGSHLTDVKFTQARLYAVNFESAYLPWACLKEAVCNRATNFYDTYLWLVDFRGADLSEGARYLAPENMIDVYMSDSTKLDSGFKEIVLQLRGEYGSPDYDKDDDVDCGKLRVGIVINLPPGAYDEETAPASLDE